MKKLPVDVSNFRTLIEEGYLYIDKTKLIHTLIEEGKYYFLSRPRRFGKSLLISTLEEIFLGSKELFRGTWIGSSSYSWSHHPVVKLNFSTLDVSSSSALQTSLSLELDDIAEEHGVDLSKYPTPGTKLKGLIKRLSKTAKVALLIDEYDYPLVHNLRHLDVARENQELLGNFFSVIKGLEEYIRAVFITGISKFAKTSIFAGMNNLNDLSLDPLAASLLGYTEEEITSYFGPYITQLAGVQDEDTIREMMRLWYNGYCFSRIAVKVYNPFSILYLFKKQKFDNYWFESATPSFLVKLLAQEEYPLDKLTGVEETSRSLGTFTLDDLPLTTLLFQTGYLTISSYDAAQDTYTLDYPNLEVQASYTSFGSLFKGASSLP